MYVGGVLCVQRDANAVLSGLREVYFGELLRGELFVAQYVEHFRKRVRAQDAAAAADDGTDIEELWLVFKDEGVSLQQHLYQVVAAQATGQPGQGDTGPVSDGSPPSDGAFDSQAASGGAAHERPWSEESEGGSTPLDSVSN